jgi:hypothetical protein
MIDFAVGDEAVAKPLGEVALRASRESNYLLPGNGFAVCRVVAGHGHF